LTKNVRNQRSKTDPTARRLMTIPGVGPIVATAITARVPAAEGFRAGSNFAAWLGLTPLQKSTGGKQKLGAVSKRGERTIRRLLIIGASAVVQQASRRGGIVACADAGSQAENAGNRGSGQQNGPHRGLCWLKAASTKLRSRQCRLTATAMA
jgi:transposase